MSDMEALLIRMVASQVVAAQYAALSFYAQVNGGEETVKDAESIMKEVEERIIGAAKRIAMKDD